MRSSLLSIGEASKLKNVSIKALRYYEKSESLSPPTSIHKVDTATILPRSFSILMSF